MNTVPTRVDEWARRFGRHLEGGKAIMPPPDEAASISQLLGLGPKPAAALPAVAEEGVASLDASRKRA